MFSSFVFSISMRQRTDSVTEKYEDKIESCSQSYVLYGHSMYLCVNSVKHSKESVTVLLSKPIEAPRTCRAVEKHELGRNAINSPFACLLAFLVFYLSLPCLAYPPPPPLSASWAEPNTSRFCFAAPAAICDVLEMLVRAKEEGKSRHRPVCGDGEI